MFNLTITTSKRYEKNMREMEREKCIKELLKVKSLSETLLHLEDMLRNMPDRELKHFHKKFANPVKNINGTPRPKRG